LNLAEKYQLDQPVIILGVHRSGTSLLTRMMETLGLFVGNDLQEDHESKMIIAVNNHYLTRTNSSWDAPHYPVQSDIDINYVARAFDASFENISATFGAMRGFWGLKDPRMAFTLPLWLQIFTHPKIIYIKRSPADIAQSLSVRHKQLIKKGIFPSEGEFSKGRIKFTQRCKSFSGALDFTLEQVSFVNRMIEGGILGGHLEFGYDELVRDPLFQMARISRFLDRDFSRNDLLAAAKLPRQAQCCAPETLIDQYFSRFAGERANR
jgi:Sulfotransferase family